jgi:lactoylglutathione lyase
MKLAYTTLFVPDVEAALAFYEAAFGLRRRFVHESGKYAELETGATALAFAAHQLAETVVAIPYRPTTPAGAPPGFELGFETDDVAAAFARAIGAGASAVSAPALKPWGQTVAYVRDAEGVRVAIVSAR